MSDGMQWRDPTRQATYKTWQWRVGSPPVGRLAAERRAETGQPPPPRPDTVDALPRVHTGWQWLECEQLAHKEWTAESTRMRG